MSQFTILIFMSIQESAEVVDGFNELKASLFLLTSLFILPFHSEWSAGEWLRFLCAMLLFYTFIWLFWKGESENERWESGIGC